MILILTRCVSEAGRCGIQAIVRVIESGIKMLKEFRYVYQKQSLPCLADASSYDCFRKLDSYLSSLSNFLSMKSCAKRAGFLCLSSLYGSGSLPD
ncbi:hypothetical protein MNBD_PLANCTO02-873 [hydrothermal vent metagenome]|uniref:Uncharacterized protein n=1 Tax=hydrothermal vent metagenome TaxID=652676 RepID=A0A3B1DAZ7_9ZZZZ